MVGYFALWLDFLTAGRTLELTDEVIVKQKDAIIQYNGFYPFIGLALPLFRIGKQVNQSSLALRKLGAARERTGPRSVRETRSGNISTAVSDSQTTGVIMPAIFDLLYFEFCRARLAEMRKQLLIAGERPDIPQGDCGVADATDQPGLAGTDSEHEIGHGPAN
jgi:hypothetical protein